MRTHDENDLMHELARECENLKQRLVRAERRMRWAGALLFAVVVLPLLLGAFATNLRFARISGRFGESARDVFIQAEW